MKLSRCASHNSDARREQLEQLQDIALSISPWTSSATWPQWQLTLYLIALTSASRASRLRTLFRLNPKVDRQFLLPAADYMHRGRRALIQEGVHFLSENHRLG